MAKWRDEKGCYRQYKAHKEQFMASHHEAVDVVDRYALRWDPRTGDTVVPMLEALMEIFENSAADGTSVAKVVGDGHVGFDETLLRSYPAGRWVEREQQRLSRAIAAAGGGSGVGVTG